MSARSWLLSPRMLLSHVLVLVAAVAMVALGFWQLHRLDEVRGTIDRIESRLQGAPRPLGSLPMPDDPEDPAAGELEFLPVTTTGTYVTGEEVLQRSRSHRGRSGYHVVTPLRTEVGTVLVRRGWVPFELDEPPVPEAAPPTGTVTVTGYLEASEPQPEGFGQRDPDEGPLPRLFHVDVARLDRQTTDDLLPVVLHLEEQSPAQPGDLPVVAPRPELSASTHLSYAVQWFTFATIAVVAYVAWLRQRLRRPTDGGAEDDVTAPRDGPRRARA